MILGFLELLGLLIDCLGWLLELLELISLVVDGISWVKSRSNRKRRRRHKKAGTLPPRRSAWTMVFIVITPIAIILGATLLWKWTH